jgi:arylsulfatase A-like enzyme/Tfp pilus assembly protein PilF
MPLRARRSFIVTAIVIAICVLAALAAWRLIDGPRDRPNILLITIDTLRADHIGAYGFKAAHTPALDRLAAEGLLCRNVIASAPITLPAHASMLTGLYPPAHGLRDNGTAALPKDVVSIAQRLTDAGYDTHAFVSAVVLGRLYGLDAGFSTYDDDLWSEEAPPLFMIRERPARRTADRVLEWFGKWQATPNRRPFFTWVHFFDPHEPHLAAPEDAAGAASPYDAEITAADRQVGRLIEALRSAGVLDDTIVLATADHGESLGEHGEATHGVFVYDATVRVPLIVRYPAAFTPGRVYDGPVRQVDYAPSLLALLGLEPMATQGVDLGPAWQGRVPAPALSQYSESLLSELGFGMAPLHAIRRDGFKRIRAPRPELYDLRADPGELTDLDARDRGRAATLDRELDAVLKATRPHAAAATPMSSETMEMLQSLGYLAQSSVRQSMAGIDPKDGIKVYRQLEQARHRGQQRRWKESEAIVREILAEMPNHVAARNVLGLALVRQRRYKEARDAYLQSLATEPDQFRVHAMLGSLAFLERDLKGAEAGYRRSLQMNPRFVEARLNLGLIASLRGDQAAAEQQYRQAEAAHPGFPATARRMGDLFYEQGRYREALTSYEEALSRAPTIFPALVQAGNSARRVGDPKKAAVYFARAAEARPDSWVPWYNLACLRSTTGDIDGAFAALDESRRRGIADPSLLRTDPDLQALRRDRRFARLTTAVGVGGP